MHAQVLDPMSHSKRGLNLVITSAKAAAASAGLSKGYAASFPVRFDGSEVPAHATEATYEHVFVKTDLYLRVGGWVRMTIATPDGDVRCLGLVEERIEGAGVRVALRASPKARRLWRDVIDTLALAS